MKLIDTLKKQGGIKLISQYLQSGALFAVGCIVLLLGKSRTSLELARNAAGVVLKRKLWRKYKKDLLEFDKIYQETEYEHRTSDKVWICWFQGIENAPAIVKKCYESVKQNMPDKEIVLLTSDNLLDYVTFPDFIMEKWEKGIITHTHMTDLLRLELLIKYGGMWIDATVLCSDSDIPKYMFESDLFLFQTLKPGRDGQPTYISSWLMSAKTNNRILMATRHLCYAYWKKNQTMIDYFLLHDFMSIVMEYYPDDWNRIVPRDNAAPHILLLRLFESFDESLWEAIKCQTCFHKLSYKFSPEQMGLENTFYKELLCEKEK